MEKTQLPDHYKVYTKVFESAERNADIITAGSYFNPGD
jgi:hypothetical protein